MALRATLWTHIYETLPPRSHMTSHKYALPVHVPRPPDDPDGLRPPRRHLLHAPGMMISVCENNSDKDVQGSGKRWFPGCVNAARKARQKW